MREHVDGWVELELADLIRMNQLVRHRIDLEGFTRWYDSLSSNGQAALMLALAEYADQARFDPADYQEALGKAGLTTDAPLAKELERFYRPFAAMTVQRPIPFHAWLTMLDNSDRFTLFKLFVYLFGKAEGRVFSGEDKECCNHWWHRDLLDERVVQALLNNPTYYLTSMKDDDDLL